MPPLTAAGPAGALPHVHLRSRRRGARVLLAAAAVGAALLGGPAPAATAGPFPSFDPVINPPIFFPPERLDPVIIGPIKPIEILEPTIPWLLMDTVTVTARGTGQIVATGASVETQLCNVTLADETCTFRWLRAGTSAPRTVELKAFDVPYWSFGTWTPSTGSRTVTADARANPTVTADFVDPAPIAGLGDLADGAIVGGEKDLTLEGADDDGLVKTTISVTPASGGDPVFATEGTAAPLAGRWNTRSAPDGVYLVTAQAHDLAGQVSAPVTRTVTVDNTPPSVAFASGPADGATFGPGTTQAWTFAAEDAGTGVAAVACRLDGGDFGPCTGPGSASYSGLAEGAHSVTVRATDRAGVVREHGRAFAIDATPPRTTITGGPADGATLSSADPQRWTFAADDPGARFECRLYPAALTPPAFAPCSERAEQSATDIPAGRITLEVRATDPYGNVEGQPAKRTFTVSGTGGDVLDERGGKVSLRYAYSFKAKGSRTWFTRLKIDGVTPGATVTATCTGKGCPKRLTVKKSRGALAVPALIGRKLAAGTKLELRATTAARTGRIVRLTVAGPGRIAALVRCTSPGKTKPVACPK